MNEIDPSKYINIINRNNTKNSKNNLIKYSKRLGIRILIVLIIFLSLSIIYKKNDNLKNTITEYVFKDEISFIKIKNIYDKYLGGLLPIKKEISTKKVFNEKLNYNNLSVYHDGVNLSVSESYLVPSLDEGMVVFIGNKDNYGNTVIIENLDGIYIWYGNINTTSLKLYDYVEKGTYIGEVSNNLYLIFSKDNIYLNYDEYIK